MTPPTVLSRAESLRDRVAVAWSNHHAGHKLPGEQLGLPGWADVARSLEARAQKLEARSIDPKVLALLDKHLGGRRTP